MSGVETTAGVITSEQPLDANAIRAGDGFYESLKGIPVSRLKIADEAEGVSDSLREAIDSGAGRLIAAGSAAAMTAEDIEQLYTALDSFQDAIDNKPAIYTNRAARRARARADRKN